MLELLWVLCVICKWARGIFVRFCCLPLRRGSGLKLSTTRAAYTAISSPSAKREWIEIRCNPLLYITLLVSLCEEGVDWNRDQRWQAGISVESPSAKREWIEIWIAWRIRGLTQSPSARREWIEILWLMKNARRLFVSLCEEGVDWNIMYYYSLFIFVVSLCEEGVDWNTSGVAFSWMVFKSPSARREWIEIFHSCSTPWFQPWSPSARREWIEIFRL